jgi:F-type H+-transporting ATPase subunit gamma
MVSTKNIKKITASMKMVSAAKLKGDEGRLKVARPFNAWTAQLAGPAMDVEDATFDELPQRTLLVPFTSDRGLCGGINTFITRATKQAVSSAKKAGKECDIVIIGDKGRAQIRRFLPEHIIRSATEVNAPGTYALASALATELVEAGAADYDGICFIYNHFVNSAVYKQKYKIIRPFVREGEDGETLMDYEFDGDQGNAKIEMMENMYEYALASNMFFTFMDSAASEQSSRMAAMENATKNAGELIGKLTLKYNRARQSRITTELIEIISGASALDDK